MVFPGRRRSRPKGRQAAATLPVPAGRRRRTAAEASEHARAVFATLREAVGDEEYFDVTAQLPPDYGVLLPGP